MKLNTKELTDRVDELITLGNEALSTEWANHMGSRNLNLESFYKFRAASISFLLKLFGDSHPYFNEFSNHAENAQPSSAKRGIGILKAVKDEIEKGWLNTTRGLISADIFGDLIEMAEHLLEENYKDPAAVLIGSALEQHLKMLAIDNKVETTYENKGKQVPKKADVLNADLVKANVYTKIDQKSITSWLGIRNDAAHGKFDEYNKEQVQFMIIAVSEFMGRTAS